jgi:hypothetical protein
MIVLGQLNLDRLGNADQASFRSSCTFSGLSTLLRLLRRVSHQPAMLTGYADLQC